MESQSIESNAHSHTCLFYNFARATSIPRTAVSGFGSNKFVCWFGVTDPHFAAGEEKMHLIRFLVDVT